MLKHSPDPTVRSYLIDRLGPFGAHPSDIKERLEAESDVEIRRALILSLGQYTDEQLPPSERSELIEKLFAVYAQDSDAGIHAAAEWLLRTWGQGERIKHVTDRLRTGEAQLRQRYQMKFEGQRWYVNGEGQAMVVLPGPVQFLMGSPPSEVGRNPNEGPCLVGINRTFAIGAKPVTDGEFRRWYPTHQHAEGPDFPAGFVTWYMAAHYCNWLSKLEELPESEWCYEYPHALPALIGSIGLPAGSWRFLPGSCGVLAQTYFNYREAMKLAPNYLHRTGYRLPTEAEMEYATRAGAVTSRFCGDSEELLVKYAWIVENSAIHIRPVGRLKPNDFGLFDMHGNVWCWCLDAYRQYPRGEPGHVFEDKEELELTFNPQQERVLRGGCYTDHAARVRSANRYDCRALLTGGSFCFRLARTIARN
jgi:formylglycine-generating enzyme required for sulfatase activity